MLFCRAPWSTPARPCCAMGRHSPTCLRRACARHPVRRKLISRRGAEPSWDLFSASWRLRARSLSGSWNHGMALGRRAWKRKAPGPVRQTLTNSCHKCLIRRELERGWMRGFEPPTTGTTKCSVSTPKSRFSPGFIAILLSSAGFASRLEKCPVFPSNRGRGVWKSGSLPD